MTSVWRRYDEETILEVHGFQDGGRGSDEVGRERLRGHGLAATAAHGQQCERRSHDN
jgi:hypothetical protein